jgi:cyclic lactone autoinducer peptide
MKEKLKTPLRIICSVLLLAAPLIVTTNYCFHLWGEPDCPDCLNPNINN